MSEFTKLSMHTLDLTQANIEKIAQLFPHVVTEAEDEDGKLTRKIDFDLLRQSLSPDLVEDTTERYRLDRPGKKRALLKANTPITKTLRPVPEDSVNRDTTQNLYLEGDNFEILKILQESYLCKIKMIYIDPPYNTGKDFVYRDDFKVSKSDYESELGAVDEEWGKLFKNTDTNGRYHSDWLSMMYSRLTIARDLLKDDGVIFMSIDDNEVHNLRKIADEVFGEENVEVLIWNKEANGSSWTLKQTSTTRRIHEYIICAYKGCDDIQFNKIREALSGREHEFQTANLAVNSENERTDHRNYFTITNPSGDTFTKQWKRSESEINELIKQDLIYWWGDWHKQPRLIIPTDERRTTFLLSILNYWWTTIGRKDFEILMWEEIEFSYPKPVILLGKLIETATIQDSIILDFFSWSATTAHAVMQLNAEDGGNRKFIMAQLPEETDPESEAYKAWYKYITEIGKERIRRAGKKILEDNKDKEGIENLDIGFRVYRTDTTNMKDVYYHPSQIKQSDLWLFTSNIKDDRTPQDLLTQVMLDRGLTLDLPMRETKVGNNTVFYVAENALVACFDEKIDMDIIDQIAECQPLKVVFRDACFKDVADRINVETRMKRLSPDTQISVI